MMKDIEIKISRETRMVDLSKTTIGNDGENLQGNLVFSFTDGFVKGQGRLEYIINGESKYAFLLNGDDNYYIPIKSVMTKEGQIDMQLVITEGTDVNEIPIFKSNVFYVSCKKSINAEVEEEEGYYSWIEIANTKLNEVDEVVKNVETKLANGEFDGKDGKDFTYEDFTEEQLENLRGPQGVPGEPGADGKDYILTEADKQEIADNLNEENNNRITSNEKYISELESTIDILTNTDTKKGELVHITDALPLATFENKVDGNVKQETTTGKNLFDVNTISNNNIDVSTGVATETNTNDYYRLSEYIEIEPNTNYVLSWVNEKPSLNNLIKFVYYDDKKTFISGVSSDFINVSKYSLTTPSNAKFIRFAYLIIVNEESSPKNNIQLEKGSTPTEYEPFTNGASPNPEYPQEIEVIEGSVDILVNGKNRLNLKPYTNKSNGITTVFDGKKFKINGTTTSNWAYLSKEFPLHLQPGKYTISKYKATSFQLAIKITDEKGKISNIYLGKPTDKITFEIKKKTKKALLFFDSVVPGTVIDEECELQLELGEASTKFEIPQEQIVYLDLKGNWVGAINDTIKDYLVTDKKKYWLVKNVGKVVLNGSESWQMDTTKEITQVFALWSWLPNNISDNNSLLSNYFISRPGDTEKISFSNDQTKTSVFIAVNKTTASTVVEFKKWLSEHNTTFYHGLKEPQIIELGELPEPIKTFEGINNIQLLANLDTEIEVKYGLDLKKYYDNKLAEISAQII